MELEKETALVETILFLESEPVNEKVIASVSQLSIEVVQKCIENLKEKYKAEATGIELEMITGGWTLVPKTEYWEQLKERYGEKNSGKLSKSAIETLSIIAYSQPVTRGEIESIRGVGIILHTTSPKEYHTLNIQDFAIQWIREHEADFAGKQLTPRLHLDPFVSEITISPNDLRTMLDGILKVLLPISQPGIIRIKSHLGCHHFSLSLDINGTVNELRIPLR